MLRSPSVPAILLAASVLPASWAWADNADTANKSNNPLNLAPGANLQDYYSPRLFDTNAHTNDLLLRGTLPIAPSDVLGVPQLLRATLPISTRPDPHSGYSTGIGDLNLFDIFLLKTEGVQLGIGPQLTAPTAERDELGTGKWQAGLAAIAIDASPRGLLGALVQYQSSFAGDRDRAHVESATFQPFIIHNLPKRSEEHTLNSSHLVISYAVFCLKKKKTVICTHTSCKEIQNK